MSKITTVIFDIGGVLTDYTAERYFLNRGYAPDKAHALWKATMASPFWNEYDRGIFSTEQVTELFCRATPELAAEIPESLGDGKGLVLRKDTAIPWIRSLKERGLRVLYLSNFSEMAMKSCQDAMDFLPETDGGILSYKDQVIKPDPAIYKLLISRYDLDPRACVFIDDTLANLPMAEHFGIHTILYRDQQQAERDLDQLLESGEDGV